MDAPLTVFLATKPFFHFKDSSYGFGGFLSRGGGMGIGVETGAGREVT